jgi:hypothetical protein
VFEVTSLPGFDAVSSGEWFSTFLKDRVTFIFKGRPVQVEL